MRIAPVLCFFHSDLAEQNPKSFRIVSCTLGDIANG